MVILVTGATGFLGFRTLEKLIELPGIDQIIANGRTLKSTHEISHEKVQYVLGDLTNLEFVQTLIQPVTHIIHAAALSSPWGNHKMFHDANVVVQNNLIEACKGKDIQKFVYISTPSLYFDFKDRFNIKESDPLPSRFVNDYSKTKRQAEIALEKSNLPFVTLRPRALTGRGDTVIMPRLIKAFDEGKLKIMGKGNNIVDLTSVANAVDAIILSLHADGKALCQTYNISNGDPVNLWEKITLVLNKLNKKLPAKKIPEFIVKSAASIMERKSKMTNMKEPTLTKYGVGTLTKSLTMDISKAKELLGYVPKMTTDQAIEEFVNWYSENEEN